MRNHLASSKPESALLRNFVARSGKGDDKTPEEIIEALIDDHRRTKLESNDVQMQLFLQARNVLSVESSRDLDCDGLIEPLGRCYEDGFRVRLNSSCTPARQRFTLAHEACHTFFYELVSEMKFKAHTPNDEEERLCNFGAAALLIPVTRLRRTLKGTQPSLDTLQMLASEFGVSMPAMFLRLRALSLWSHEFSVWHRMVDGSFALGRLYGGRRANWKWTDESVLETAWEKRNSVFGRTFVQFQDAEGIARFKPVSFELRHHGGGLIALWGKGLKRPKKADAPLLKEDDCNASRLLLV